MSQLIRDFRSFIENREYFKNPELFFHDRNFDCFSLSGNKLSIEGVLSRIGMLHNQAAHGAVKTGHVFTAAQKDLLISLVIGNSEQPGLIPLLIKARYGV
jgi:hypothetical protein